MDRPVSWRRRLHEYLALDALLKYKPKAFGLSGIIPRISPNCRIAWIQPLRRGAVPMKYLFWLPLRRESIRIPLTKDATMQRISENVEWGKVLALELVGVRRGDFAGRRSGQSFTIAKSIGYQNIYLPYARCRVSEAEDGATVVDMHFYAPFSVPFILFLAVATRNIIGSERILTWFVFVVIVHLVGVSLFHWETQRVLDKLRTVLN